MAEWTEAYERILRQGYKEGLSASQIAARIPGMSKNSVIGKAHRLGVVHKNPRGASSGKRGPAPRSGASMIKPTPRNDDPRGIEMRVAALKDISAEMKLAAGVKTQPLPTFKEAVSGPLLIPLLELEASMCKWSCAECPETGLHLFCGHQRVPGSAYCGPHASRAYQSVAKYRSKDRQAA